MTGFGAFGATGLGAGLATAGAGAGVACTAALFPAPAFFTDFLAVFLAVFLAAFLADFFGAALDFFADFFADFLAVFFAAFFEDFFEAFLRDFLADFFFAIAGVFLPFLPFLLFFALAIVILLLPPINIHRPKSVDHCSSGTSNRPPLAKGTNRSVHAWPGAPRSPIKKLNRVHNRN